MAKRPTSPRTAPPAPAAEEPEEVQPGDLNVEELIQGYEAQIGYLSGQVIRQNLVIKNLKGELLKKNGPAPAAG